jgi:hypothetical protein
MGFVCLFPDQYLKNLKLCQDGKIGKLYDRRYPLQQIVEAHRYVDKHND